MNQKKDIQPRNGMGQRHGYWEVYHDNGSLYYEGEYKKGVEHGYWKCYWHTGHMMYEGEYLNDGRDIGLWLYYSSDGSVQQKEYHII